MPTFIEPYETSVVALGVFGAVYLFQLLIADVIAIKARQTPGTPVAPDHEQLLFRATRAHANTTESIGAAILIAAFAILVGSDAVLVNRLVVAYVGFRVLHMAAYYFNQKLLRSVSFGLGVGSLLWLFGVGVRALW